MEPHEEELPQKFVRIARLEEEEEESLAIFVWFSFSQTHGWLLHHSFIFTMIRANETPPQLTCRARAMRPKCTDRSLVPGRRMFEKSLFLYTNNGRMCGCRWLRLRLCTLHLTLYAQSELNNLNHVPCDLSMRWTTLSRHKGPGNSKSAIVSCIIIASCNSFPGAQCCIPSNLSAFN